MLLLVVCALPTVAASGWRPGVERRVQEEAAPAPAPRRALLPAGHHRRVRRASCASSGSAGGWRRGRREAWEEWYAPTTTARWASAVLVHPGLDRLRARLRRGGRLGDPRARRARWPTCCWCWPRAAGCPGTSARRSARSASCAACGSTGRAGWPGWRTTPRRSAPATGAPPDRVADGHPVRPRLVRLPRRPRPAGAPGRVAGPAGRVGRRGGGRERRRQVDAGQAARPDVRPDVGPDAGRRRTPRRDRPRGVARADRRRLPGLLPLRARRAAVDRRRRPAAARRRGRGARPRWVGPVPTTSSAASRPASRPSSDRSWPGGVDLSFGQWQKVALARGFMREDPLLLVLDEPTAALDAETEHALFERFAEAARDGERRGPDHGARLAPLLHGADGRPDRGPRRRRGRRGREPRGADGGPGQVRRAVRRAGGVVP